MRNRLERSHWLLRLSALMAPPANALELVADGSNATMPPARSASRRQPRAVQPLPLLGQRCPRVSLRTDTTPPAGPRNRTLDWLGTDPRSAAGTSAPQRSTNDVCPALNRLLFLAVLPESAQVAPAYPPVEAVGDPTTEHKPKTISHEIFEEGPYLTPSDGVLVGQRLDGLLHHHRVGVSSETTKPGFSAGRQVA